MKAEPNNSCAKCNAKGQLIQYQLFTIYACTKHRNLIIEAAKAARDKPHFMRLIGIK